MNNNHNIQIDKYDFLLPEEKIAIKPVKPREQAKMLVLTDDELPFIDTKIANLPEYLNENDAIVVNDTKVIKNYLVGKRIRKNNFAKISINIIRQTEENQFEIMLKPARKVQQGDVLVFKSKNIELKATVIREINEHHEKQFIIQFHDENSKDKIQQIASMPLPPYITKLRQAEKIDEIDYQTIFAKNYGSIAAPTAGCHFTTELVEKCKQKGVVILSVSLHVGSGTFKPIRGEFISQKQKLHSEKGTISKKTADEFNQIKKNKNSRVIAIGTTTLRLLETCADKNGFIKPFNGNTDIFIKPGYKFKTVDMMLTNFHLPKSSLFLLVCAFANTKLIKKAYQHAIQNQYRFYTYGDACLIKNNNPY